MNRRDFLKTTGAAGTAAAIATIAPGTSAAAADEKNMMHAYTHAGARVPSLDVVVSDIEVVTKSEHDLLCATGQAHSSTLYWVTED